MTDERDPLVVKLDEAIRESIRTGKLDMAIIADHSVIPREYVAELIAALDRLHRAYGGGGIELASHTVTTDILDGKARITVRG